MFQVVQGFSTSYEIPTFAKKLLHCLCLWWSDRVLGVWSLQGQPMNFEHWPHRICMWQYDWMPHCILIYNIYIYIWLGPILVPLCFRVRHRRCCGKALQAIPGWNPPDGTTLTCHDLPSSEACEAWRPLVASWRKPARPVWLCAVIDAWWI